MDELLEWTDSSFKYILIGFNFITLVIAYLYKRRNAPKKQHNIVLITAHPDDQCMFFRPTINCIKKDYFIHLLCLSGGNTERQQQLKIASSKLGFDKITCLEKPQLLDNMKSIWCPKIIQEIVSNYVSQNNIKAIFTFDDQGISRHSNHISVSQALSQLKCKGELNSNPENNTIKMYQLESVNILRKYTGVAEIIIALIKQYSFIDFNLINAWKVMSSHQTQFVWYRKLWVIFSRYSFINTYQRNFITFNKIKQQ